MPAPARLAEPKYVSATRACQLIGCAHDTLYRLAALGLVHMRLDHFSGRPVYKLSDVRARAPASLAGLQRTRSSPRPRPRPRPRSARPRRELERRRPGGQVGKLTPPNRSQCHTKRVHLNRFERHHMTSYTLKSARQVLPVSGVACLPMPKSRHRPPPPGGPPLLGARRCAFVDSAKHPEQFRRLGPLAVARSPEISGVSDLGILATSVQMCENLGAKRSPRTAANGRGHVPLDATRRDFSNEF